MLPEARSKACSVNRYLGVHCYNATVWFILLAVSKMLSG